MVKSPLGERKPRIVKIRVVVESDPDFPLEATLGSFDREAKSDFAINHLRRQGGRGDCEWFNSANADARVDAERDYLEMMHFVHGRKWMMSVAASAEIRVPCGQGSVAAKVGPFRADGFDSEDDDGRREAEKQAREELATELETLGFAATEVGSAINGAEAEEG